MSGVLINFARTLVQAGWGWAVAHFAVLAIIPSDTAVNWILTTVVIAGAAAGLHWLETRQGDTFRARAARLVAKWLMLGLSGSQPVYVQPGQNVRVLGADGLIRPPR